MKDCFIDVRSLVDLSFNQILIQGWEIFHNYQINNYQDVVSSIECF